MTTSRRDGNGTEFGLWLRRQPEIDSRQGFVASDVDYIWKNYTTNEWMIIEEKRYCRDISDCQKDLLVTLHKAAQADVNYKGIHLLVFEKTSPDDGRIWLDRQEISRSELIYFLQHFIKAKNFSYSV